VKLTSVWVAALLGLLWAAQGSAHPAHHSYAEVEWSAEGTLDVALRVIPEDLEAALSRRAGTTVVLVNTPVVREQLASYLAQHFVLQPAGHAAAPEVLGLDVAYGESWIYFSIAADREQILSLRNTVLMDHQEGQINRVRLLWASSAATLVFTEREPERQLGVIAE
jgi:hypothetical protein